MQTQTRIPALPNGSTFAMHRWFYKMYQADLLYHPDDPAETIVNIGSGQPTFSADECAQLDAAVSRMFDNHGDKVYDVAMQYFQKTMAIESK